MADVIRRRLNSLVKTAIVVLMLVIGGGLLASGVLQVNQRAHLVTCADNLRQIAAAAHDYFQQHERLPPGWLGPHYDAPSPNLSEPAPYAGVLTFLFPHLEQEQLYNELWINRDIRARTDTGNIDPRTGEQYVPPANEYWWQGAGPSPGRSNWQLAQTRIMTFLCPSDDSWRAESVIAGVHIFGGRAPNDFIYCRSFAVKEEPSARHLGRTNYVGVAGAGGEGSKELIEKERPGWTWGLYAGLFYNRQLPRGQLAVQDGPGTSLLFGETIGGIEPTPSGERRAALSWFVGALPTLHGLTGPDQGRWDMFGSRHRDVVQFVLGDGSLRRLRRGQTTTRYSYDWWVLQELAGWRDGGTRNTSTLVD